jgi:hypothetical protein
VTEWRWGTPKEYAVYHGLLLSDWSRDRFLLWLKNERPDLHALTLKEIAKNGKTTSPDSRQAR